jgi:hypothetical protein
MQNINCTALMPASHSAAHRALFEETPRGLNIICISLHYNFIYEKVLGLFRCFFLSTLAVRLLPERFI